MVILDFVPALSGILALASWIVNRQSTPTPTPQAKVGSPAIEQPPGINQTTYPWFYLQAKVLRGDQTKDNLYVTGYHTGAGLNDVVLTQNISIARKGYLNETSGAVTFPIDNYGLIYYLERTEWQRYARWNKMDMNLDHGGKGDYGARSGYILNDHGLTYPSAKSNANGWLACDWYHLVPQLFFQDWKSNEDDMPLPSSCAKVELHTVPTEADSADPESER